MLDKKLRNAVANDPIRTVQTWEAEMEEDNNEMDKYPLNYNEDGEHDEYSIERNPYKYLFSTSSTASPPPSRRRLLSSTMQHDAASTHQKQPSELDADDSSIDDAELLLDDDFNILNNVRTMKGGSYFPRTITAPSESDLSKYWSTINLQPGFLHVETRPLLDLINHQDVIKRCFNIQNKDEVLPRVTEFARTPVGRRLLRRQIFWENFLLYMNIKALSLETNRKKYVLEKIIVQRATQTKMEMIERFQQSANQLDQTASGSGMMLTRLGGWTRLGGLIREAKDSVSEIDIFFFFSSSFFFSSLTKHNFAVTSS
jgi:hypothetical protein